MGLGNKVRLLGLGLLCCFLLVGCLKADPTPDFGPLRTEVEKLYRNYHELKVVHSDLHKAAQQHIAEAGGQLAEIQSAARFINQANLIAYYQWELLSITAYIREASRRDFFTLRVRGVGDARQKSKDLIMAINVYEAFIRDPEVLELIQKGVAHIQRNVKIFARLQEQMTPLANPPAGPAAAHPQTSL